MQLRADLGLPCSTVTIQGNNHYIKDLVKDGRLKVAYVPKDNCADPFTKTLEPAAYWQFVRMHGMTSLK